MRKLKLQVQISLDGFIAGPKGEMEWMEWNWDDQLRNYISQIMNPVDCIILGRKLAEGFIPYWAEIALKPDDPDFEPAKMLTRTQKVVFTKTLQESKWENTILAKGDLVEEIKKLKDQDGQDIIAYGGATFVSALIKERLIDEFYFLLDPTAIGHGLPIFNEIGTMQGFSLIESTPFNCGIVVLHYEQKK
ncbi:dihydrofolate reductase family protein [Dyadobacter subterraneus]|uniref:Dihydrofolate reductase family protein n=1 Tax=Dyadobacter subterraneus TaxID=2773304 RepID=A0ABR9WEM4_9BACT|nr:dihydrofolate reductase family protein [Dyadobacter subterraneus]MBE9463947.1 dihydrofolate reductase family protein [Dyadobacter subterraneus]